jgi:hypothetical protein
MPIMNIIISQREPMREIKYLAVGNSISGSDVIATNMASDTTMARPHASSLGKL